MSAMYIQQVGVHCYMTIHREKYLNYTFVTYALRALQLIVCIRGSGIPRLKLCWLASKLQLHVLVLFHCVGVCWRNFLSSSILWWESMVLYRSWWRIDRVPPSIFLEKICIYFSFMYMYQSSLLDILWCNPINFFWLYVFSNDPNFFYPIWYA